MRNHIADEEAGMLEPLKKPQPCSVLTQGSSQVKLCERESKGNGKN